jgi:excisionase family DNA binding protein
MNTEERWVDVAGVATHLGVRRESVYRWIDAKGLPAHRVGRLLRFKLSEVDDWVRAGRGDETGARKDEDAEPQG